MARINFADLYFSGAISFANTPVSAHNAIRLECLRILGMQQRNRDCVTLYAPSVKWIDDNIDTIVTLQSKYGDSLTIILGMDDVRLAINTLVDHCDYTTRSQRLTPIMIRTVNKRGGNPNSILAVRLTEYVHKDIPSNLKEVQYNTEYLSYTQTHTVLRLESEMYPSNFGLVWYLPSLSNGAVMVGETVSPFECKWTGFYDLKEKSLNEWVSTGSQEFYKISDFVSANTRNKSKL